jgi:hypothetical protein
VALVGAALALVLAGCADGGKKISGDDTASNTTLPPPPGTWSVEAPASTFGGSGATLSINGAVTSEKGSGPVYLAGSQRRSPDRPSTPAMLVSGGADWNPAVGPAFDMDNAAIGDVASAADSVVGVGSQVTDGTSKPVAWTGKGTKPEGWTSAVLDPGLEGDSLLNTVAALDDGTYVAAGLVGPDTKGERQLLVGRTDAAGAWSFQTVGSRASFSYAVDIAAHDRTVVVLGVEEEPSGLRPTAYASTDGGATFAEAAEGAFGGPRSGGLAGVEWMNGRFVAVGSAENGTDLGAWSSPDGVAWSPLDATVNGAPIPVLPSQVSSLTGPGGSVMFIGGQSREQTYGALLVALQVPGPSGNPEWGVQDYPEELTSTGVVRGPGPLVGTVKGDIVASVNLPGTVAIGRQVAGSSSMSVTKPGTLPLPAVAESTSGTDLAVNGDRRLVSGSKGPRAKDKTIGYEGRLWRGGPDGWVTMDNLPDDLSSIIDVAPRPEGGFAVLGYAGGIQGVQGTTASFGRRAPLAQGANTDVNDLWVGTLSDDGTLTRTGLIAGPGEQQARHLTRIDDTWYVAGSVQPDQNASATTAGLWSSTDLASWEPVAGTLGSGSVTNVCATTDGLLAVGFRDDDRLVARPAAWLAGADGVFADLGPDKGLPTGRGALAGCAGDRKGTLVVGSEDDTPLVLSFGDGALTRTSFAATRNVYATAIIKSDKGYIVAGTDASRALNRIEVWTSPTGDTWSSSLQPDEFVGSDGSGVNDIALDGDRLLLLGDQGPQSVLWAISDPFS